MGLQSDKRDQTHTYTADYLWAFISVSEYKKINVIVNFLEEFIAKSMSVLHDVVYKITCKAHGTDE